MIKSIVLNAILALAFLVAGKALALPVETDLPDFIEVSPTVFRGGQPSATGLIYLKNIGVKTIINLQGGDLSHPYLRRIVSRLEPGETNDSIRLEADRAAESEIQFVHSSLDSLGRITPAESTLIDQTLEIMHDPKYQPIYIHCQHGKDRTGLMVALYRVKYEDVDPFTAYWEWHKSGHSTLHTVFTSGLDEYFFLRALEMTLEKMAKTPSPESGQTK